MNTKELRNEVERIIDDAREIIGLKKLQIKIIVDFIKNEELRLSHFQTQLDEMGYEKSE